MGTCNSGVKIKKVLVKKYLRSHKLCVKNVSSGQLGGFIPTYNLVERPRVDFIKLGARRKV